MKTQRSPSALRTPRLISAIRSLDPGGGRGLKNFSHSSWLARSANDDDGITKGPGVTDTIRPSKIEIGQADGRISRRKVVVRNRPRRTSASSPLTRAINASIITRLPAADPGEPRFRSVLVFAAPSYHGRNRGEVNRRAPSAHAIPSPN